MATEINKLVVPIPDGQGGYVNEEITFEGSGGSGLPTETITYAQFMAKSDSEQANYTGYVTDWPSEDGSAFALVSEGYAIGEQNGVPVTSDSPYYHNNAKYWAEWTANAIGIALNTEY